MTENTETAETVSEVETPLTFWRPRDDEAVLCETCGVKEMNASLAVMLGLVPEFASMQDAVDRFAELPDAGPGYFLQSETGTCVECGAHR